MYTFTHIIRPATSPILVSVMIPTRGRPHKLLRAIQSLQENANKRDRIEILVKVDDDDTGTLDVLSKTHLSGVLVLISPRGAGYLDLHNHIHTMASRARGEWLLAFNDDAVMKTPRWDDMFDIAVVDGNDFEDYKAVYYVDDIWLLLPQVNDKRESNEFFAVSRKVFDILGHLALNMGVDLWLHGVFSSIGRVAGLRIHIEHKNEKDTTFTDGRDVIEGGLLYELTSSIPVTRAKITDSLKLLDYIEDFQKKKINKMTLDVLPDQLILEYDGRTYQRPNNGFTGGREALITKGKR